MRIGFVAALCGKLAAQCDAHANALHPLAERYGEEADDEPERLHNDLFSGARTGPLALLRDLHDLFLMASECDMCWTLVRQAASGARDAELLAVVDRCEAETSVQLRWLRTRLKSAAPKCSLSRRSTVTTDA